MKKIIFILLMLLSTNAMAGEAYPAGHVLKEDSYVFTFDEAGRLMLRMEDLEQKEKLLLKYQELDVSNTQIIDAYKKELDLKDYQISQYKEISDTDEALVKKYEKKNNLSKLEKYGFFLLGVGVTTSSIIIADKVDGYIRTN